MTKNSRVKAKVAKNLTSAIELAAKELISNGGMSPPESATMVAQILTMQATGLFGGMAGVRDGDLESLYTEVIDVYEKRRLAALDAKPKSNLILPT